MRLPSGKPLRFILLAVVGGAVVLSLVLPQSEPLAQTHARTSEACLMCHEGYDETLAPTTHHLSEALDGVEARIACTDCHLGDARHYEEDPEEYPMPDLKAADAQATATLCSACHNNAHQQNMLERNVHAQNDVNCTACHSIHDAKHQSLLRAPQTDLCLGCHAGVEGQFAQSFRHPVADGVMTCTECHHTLDQTSRELSLNGTNACVRCHTEFQGPFPFEHQATVDYSTQEGGCLTCHAAHGSHLPRMLTQPYESPHFQLCSQCHSVPLHNRNQMHGTMWAGVACNQCHVDIHGSYTHRLFLDEALQAQGCFNVGCHQN